jgi:hypothetical protein
VRIIGNDFFLLLSILYLKRNKDLLPLSIFSISVLKRNAGMLLETSDFGIVVLQANWVARTSGLITFENIYLYFSLLLFIKKKIRIVM